MPEQLSSKDALASVSRLRKFDTDEKVFVVIAHDSSIGGRGGLFSNGRNGWKNVGWKRQTRQKVLTNFEAGVTVM